MSDKNPTFTLTYGSIYPDATVSIGAEKGNDFITVEDRQFDLNMKNVDPSTVEVRLYSGSGRPIASIDPKTGRTREPDFEPVDTPISRTWVWNEALSDEDIADLSGGDISVAWVQSADPYLATHPFDVSCTCQRCDTVFVQKIELVIPRFVAPTNLPEQTIGIGPHLCDNCRLDIPFATEEERKAQADSYEEGLFD